MVPHFRSLNLNFNPVMSLGKTLKFMLNRGAKHRTCTVTLNNQEQHVWNSEGLDFGYFLNSELAPSFGFEHAPSHCLCYLFQNICLISADSWLHGVGVSNPVVRNRLSRVEFIHCSAHFQCFSSGNQRWFPMNKATDQYVLSVCFY